MRTVLFVRGRVDVMDDVFASGDRIEVERDGVWVAARVELASPNGDSLAVFFDFPLGMALLRQPGGDFIDILTGREHRVRRAG